MSSDPSVSGYHVLKVDGYSRTVYKSSFAPVFESGAFCVGGHTWIIRYYPRGNKDSAGFISAGIYLVDLVAEPVKVRAKFSIFDHDMKSKLYSRPPTMFTFSKRGGRCHGYEKFIKRRVLGSRLRLKQDCFALRVDLFIIKEEEPSIALPPSDMHHHLGYLLSSKEHTDVEFRVGEETFAAHRLLLGARSPVFKAELISGDGGKTTRPVIQVDDMEPQVFKAMLTFIYTDTWPILQKKSAMARRLLVAADRYGLQRLKSMCEYRLCNHIDLHSVEDILLLADKHQCAALKEACFDFIGSTATLLPARESIITHRRTQELRFDRLVSLCPTITKDQIFNVLDHESVRNRVGGIDITIDKQTKESGQPCPSRRPSILQLLEVVYRFLCPARTRSGATLPSAMRTVLPACSTTTIFSLRDYHDLKINGYMRSLDTDSRGLSFKSVPFRAGGYKWHIVYRPKGDDGNSDYISFCLALDDVVDEAVLAMFTFGLLDQDKNPVPCYCTMSRTCNFSVPGKMVGRCNEFIKREILEASENLLKDDCFTLRVQIHVVKETPSILVPSSDIQQHLGSLLLSIEDADVKFQVAGKMFAAHRLVLAARSPVFNAELYSSMKEGIVTNSTIRIDDMEAQAFKAMLNFIYTDSWPEMEQEDESTMAQHLLVAADRYCLQRLKLICEARLKSHINAASVAIILVLAEKHNCNGLKKACFKFLTSSTDPLLVTETQDFEYLAQSCPSVMEELNAICLSRDLEKAKNSEGIKGNDSPSSHKYISYRVIRKYNGGRRRR